MKKLLLYPSYLLLPLSSICLLVSTIALVFYMYGYSSFYGQIGETIGGWALVIGYLFHRFRDKYKIDSQNLNLIKKYSLRISVILFILHILPALVGSILFFIASVIS